MILIIFRTRETYLQRSLKPACWDVEFLYVNRIVRCFVRRSDMSTGLLHNGQLTALGCIDSKLAYVTAVVPVQSFARSRIQEE